MHSAPFPETPDQDDAYFRAILLDLVGRGADLARRIHENAAAVPEPDAVASFDRITRTVRRTIALARHIAEPRKQDRAAARSRLIRGVEDAIHRKRRETDSESLTAEFNERLDDPALEFDLESRPIEEIIDDICRDLGVATQGRSYVHRRRTPQDIAALRTRAAAPPNPPSPSPLGRGSG